MLPAEDASNQQGAEQPNEYPKAAAEHKQLQEVQQQLQQQ